MKHNEVDHASSSSKATANNINKEVLFLTWLGPLSVRSALAPIRNTVDIVTRIFTFTFTRMIHQTVRTQLLGGFP